VLCHIIPGRHYGKAAASDAALASMSYMPEAKLRDAVGSNYAEAAASWAALASTSSMWPTM